VSDSHINCQDYVVSRLAMVTVRVCVLCELWPEAKERVSMI